jgi:hypothetical protein
VDRLIFGAIFLAAVSLLLWAHNHFAKLHQPSQHRGRIAADGAGAHQRQPYPGERQVRWELNCGECAGWPVPAESGLFHETELSRG